MPSVVDRAEKFSGRKITFIVQLPERPRALQVFLSKMPAQVNMTNIIHPPKTSDTQPVEISYEGDPSVIQRVVAALKKTGFAYQIQQ